MSQYDSTNFTPQAVPEPRGFLAKLMHGNASLLKHTKPSDQYSSAMLLRVSPSYYQEHKNSADAGRDFNEKAITVRGFSPLVMLYVHIGSLAMLVVLYLAPAAYILLLLEYFLVGGEVHEYIEAIFIYFKITLVMAFIWLPLELHDREVIKLPWLKEQKSLS